MLPIDEIRLNFNPASLAILNGVLAFLMFGIALDTRVEDFRRVLKMPLAFSVGIEWTQLELARIGRACDVTDIVDNVTGTALGALVGVVFLPLLRPWRR